MHDYVEYEERVGDLIIKIIKEDNPINPRKDCDQLGTMVCWHRRYSLGDVCPKEDPATYFSGIFGIPIEQQAWAAIDEAAETAKCLVLSLYLYDHSGLTMNTTGFSCPWDSGQVGYVYVTHKRICEEYGVKRVTALVKDQHGKMVRAIDMARRVLEAEVAIYDYYLKGEVYMYVVEDENGDTLDSCGGYLGGKTYPNDSQEEKDRSSWDYMLEEARSMARWHLEDRAKKKAERTKTYVKHRVPLEKRELAEKGA